MARRSVLISNGSGAGAVRTMFMEEGWDICSDIDDADLVQFVGGADVDPALYGHHKHRTTTIDANRDLREQELYTMALDRGIPMAGICRGGQFLNVMNGGLLYQDVDGHAMGTTHEAWLKGAPLPVKVTSTHHQMMEPNYDADVRVLMQAKASSVKRMMSNKKNGIYETKIVMKDGCQPSDVEALYYPGTRCLCFQPHPEFTAAYARETREVYFVFMADYITGDPNDHVPY